MRGFRFTTCVQWKPTSKRRGRPAGSPCSWPRLFAIAALVLTSVGVYGVLAYAVALRRHEFGVRRALGADGGHVMREVLREGFLFAIAGCTAGLGMIAIAARFLQSQLYGVPAVDPISHAGAIALILCGAAIACWIPAHRATSVSPMEALKTE